MNGVLSKIRRGVRKPLPVILARVGQELGGKVDKYLSQSRPSRLSQERLVRLLGGRDLTELWERIRKRAFPATTNRVTAHDLDSYCPAARAYIEQGAQRALHRQVDLLGTGLVDLGSPIDWTCDVKTNHHWPRAYAKSIDYSNLDRPSDVKVPWEISRLQWLIPAGQAYLLSGDERYAVCVRDVIVEWLEANPYAHTVNWSCTMEAAMRIFTLTWFFHVFSGSKAWQSEVFRFRFLQVVFLHAEYTERHIEISDIAGNHYDADAAALVFAGLFFGGGRHASRWLKIGWRILCHELPRQVYSDGVDFEASIPYHRLVQELFLFPAIYRQLHGLPVSESYRARLQAMARFSAVYSKPDGSCPLWGDADDARTLPFGQQKLNDHRYLAGLGAVAWSSDELGRMFTGPLDEIFWVFGAEGCRSLSAMTGADAIPSAAFREGGFFIMRNQRDHVFVDCGPVGLGGRGGHGHNDCLSFEAVLDGVRLITDSGAYAYTGSAVERNRFRSTAYHNTPSIDSEEINRFFAWNVLWSLRYEAIPELRRWIASADHDEFEGAHEGYRKLPGCVVPVRNIQLEHAAHSLRIHDFFHGSGHHRVEIPLHLDPGVKAEPVNSECVQLNADERQFKVQWGDSSQWKLTIEPARTSRSYGVFTKSTKLVWRRDGSLRPLTVLVSPVIQEVRSLESATAEAEPPAYAT